MICPANVVKKNDINKKYGNIFCLFPYFPIALPSLPACQ